jgi:hypothetical protein
MLHNPYCSPSTSRAAKTSGVNYIPPSLVIAFYPGISQIGAFFGDGSGTQHERISGYYFAIWTSLANRENSL